MKKKSDVLSKLVKVAPLRWNAYQMILVLENVFLILIVIFAGYLKLKFGNTLKLDEDALYFFLNKKRFYSFKRHLLQTWWVENMPVLAGRLVANAK